MKHKVGDKIVIVSCTSKYYWYRDKIGMVWSIKKTNTKNTCYEVTKDHYIQERDCISFKDPRGEMFSEIKE